MNLDLSDSRAQDRKWGLALISLLIRFEPSLLHPMSTSFILCKATRNQITCSCYGPLVLPSALSTLLKLNSMAVCGPALLRQHLPSPPTHASCSFLFLHAFSLSFMLYCLKAGDLPHFDLGSTSSTLNCLCLGADFMLGRSLGQHSYLE